MSSPSGLNGHCSALSTAFTLLGRSGEWDPETCQGNPIKSPDVSEFKSGYGRQLHAAGYEQGSAVPWTYAEVLVLLDLLDAVVADPATPVITGLLLDQTATLICYLWEGGQRAKEGGAVTLLDHTNRYCLLLAHLSSIFPYSSPPILQCWGPSLPSTLPSTPWV